MAKGLQVARAGASESIARSQTELPQRGNGNQPRVGGPSQTGEEHLPWENVPQNNSPFPRNPSLAGAGEGGRRPDEGR